MSITIPPVPHFADRPSGKLPEKMKINHNDDDSTRRAKNNTQEGFDQESKLLVVREINAATKLPSAFRM